MPVNDCGGPECPRCDGSGEIAVRTTYPMSEVGPGPAPEDARGVCATPCPDCAGHGVVDAPPILQAALQKILGLAHTCAVQRALSDDALIAEKVERIRDIARAALRAAGAGR